MTPSEIYPQILDFAHRADPYPLYSRLRENPVAARPDGSYVVSGYRAITALLHDPRVSSDRRTAAAKARRFSGFLNLDPPEHDRLRRSACATSARRPVRIGSPGCVRVCAAPSPS